jgi:cell wall-associated NlpC family hydrolase
MAELAAREIYRFARMAGFTPDQAVTMTAIAMAESGGNTGAHNPHGEDSRGLWQINARAHPDLGRRNLYDPLENAKAAYQVSGHGGDVSPWTTTHGIGDASYLRYQTEALTAARVSGDNPTGNWAGTEGYGHAMAAAGAGGAHPAGGAGGTDLAAGMHLAGGTHPAAGNSSLQTFLDSALAQEGDEYVFGAEANTGTADPTTFDCSELVQWAAGRAGVKLDDGSWNQYLQLESAGKTISVEDAKHTPGALLFSFSENPTAGGGRPSQAHVAISLGDGRTIEAASPETGVGIHKVGNRFNYAAVIPGLSDGAVGAGPVPLGTPGGGVGGAVAGGGLTAGGGAALLGLDTDKDGITDDLEGRLGTSATKVDSDGDNLSDSYEMLKLHSDPTKVDSDGDGIADSLELALGQNPLAADSDGDGMIDGAANVAGGATDTDFDGVSDLLEKILRTDPTKADTDGDGFLDGAEYKAGYNPADPNSNPLTQPTSPTSGAGSGGMEQSAIGPHHDTSWGLEDIGGH